MSDKRYVYNVQKCIVRNYKIECDEAWNNDDLRNVVSEIIIDGESNTSEQRLNGCRCVVTSDDKDIGDDAQVNSVYVYEDVFEDGVWSSACTIYDGGLRSDV